MSSESRADQDYATRGKALKGGGRSVEERLALLKLLREESERATERAMLKKAAADFSKNLKPGKTVPRQGVYIGTWEPKDRNGKSLGKIFSVFAAPQDLTNDSGQRALLTFKAAAERLAGLKNWHGFDGGSYASDTALYEAIRNGSYKGEWVIPTSDILAGNDHTGNRVQEETLYAAQEKGDLAGTFLADGAGSDGFSIAPDWYWSCTGVQDAAAYAINVRFSDGCEDVTHTDTLFLGCRPVRFVELRPAAPGVR